MPSLYTRWLMTKQKLCEYFSKILSFHDIVILRSYDKYKGIDPYEYGFLADIHCLIRDRLTNRQEWVQGLLRLDMLTFNEHTAYKICYSTIIEEDSPISFLYMMRITPTNIAKIQLDSNYSFGEIYHVLWQIKEKQKYKLIYCKIVEDSKREYCRAEFLFYDTKILTLMLCNYNNYLFMERYTSFNDLIFDDEFMKSQQVAARPLSKSTEPLSHDVYLDPQIIDKQYNQTLIVPDFLDRSLQEHLNLWMIVIPWILILLGNIIVACFHPIGIIILMFSVVDLLLFLTHFIGVFEKKLPNYYLKMILNLLFLFSITLGVIFYCFTSILRLDLIFHWFFGKLITFPIILWYFDASKHCAKNRSNAIVVFRNV